MQIGKHLLKNEGVFHTVYRDQDKTRLGPEFLIPAGVELTVKEPNIQPDPVMVLWTRRAPDRPLL